MIVRRLRSPSSVAVALAALLAAGASEAAPFGLTPGETITSLEIESIGGTSGYTAGTKTLAGTGDVTAVNTDMGILTPPTVTWDFSSILSSQNNTYTAPFLSGQAYFQTTGGTDFAIQEGGVNVLTGVFVGNLVVSGTINVSGGPDLPVSAIGRVQFTGGTSSLLAALGGMGGQANVILQSTVTSFSPSLTSLASDLNVYNSDFTFELSGTLKPLNPAPFVPEPSTAVLLASGLLGLLAVSRRVRARG
jgi:hypothetical protein